MPEMFTITNIAQTINSTAEIREASFDHKGAEKTGVMVDFRMFYAKTLEESAEEACKKHGVDIKFAKLIYLALDGWWNDTLNWADSVLKS